MNPRFLDPPSTAPSLAPCQHAYLRKGRRQTPAPRCSQASPIHHKPAQRRSPSSPRGGHGKNAAFHGRRVGLIETSTAPPMHLDVVKRPCAPRVRVGRSQSQDRILNVDCDNQYRATSRHIPLGNYCRHRHRSTPQTRPQEPAP